MTPTGRSPGLLVSVRSAAEARAALAGGADLIDVKEPTRGPLGAADPDVIRGVVDAVAGRAPVSAALGEWTECTARLGGYDGTGLAFVKWGLAQVAEPAARRLLKSWRGVRPVPVVVAYADSRRANSPDPELLARAACQLWLPVFLFDTAVKDGSSLLDWIKPATLARIRFQLADAGARIAFAGSLDQESIRRLLPLSPDWFAVRGAACVGGRAGSICPDRVRALKEIISAGQTEAAVS